MTDLRTILFPEDDVTDQKLQAVIIDMEFHGGDQGCIKTLKEIYNRLSQARYEMDRSDALTAAITTGFREASKRIWAVETGA